MGEERKERVGGQRGRRRWEPRGVEGGEGGSSVSTLRKRMFLCLSSCGSEGDGGRTRAEEGEEKLT